MAVVAPTCSLLFRNGVFDNLPEWYYEFNGGDWLLQILAASQGKMRYFTTAMGVFRKHQKGARYHANQMAKVQGESILAIPSRNALGMCEALDKHFEYRYSDLLQKQKAYWYWSGALEYGIYGEKKLAFTYLYNALPFLFPVPSWLSYRVLCRGIMVILSPPISDQYPAYGQTST